MEYLKLLGIVIIVVGFALKWDTTAVVVFSAADSSFFGHEHSRFADHTWAELCR